MTATPVNRKADMATIRVRIERAKLHLADYEARTRPYLAECVHGVIQDYDEQRSEHVIRIGQLPEIPHDLSVILGDAIHNLRISLDYLAWQLVLASGQEPVRRTYFPVHPKRRTPKDGGPLPDIEPGMPQQVRILLDEIQPYQRNHPRNHQLNVLHQLDIADKHHDLLYTYIDANRIGWFGDADIRTIEPGPYDNGSEICRFALPGNAYPPGWTKDSVQFSAHPMFDLCLRETAAGAWNRTVGASDLIHILLKYVEGEVIPRFHSYF